MADQASLSASLSDLREFFGGEDGYRKVTKRELIEMKREDPDGLDELRTDLAELQEG